MENSLCPFSELLHEPNLSYHLHHALCHTRHGKQTSTAGVGLHINAATSFPAQLGKRQASACLEKKEQISTWLHRLAVWSHKFQRLS